MSPARRNWTSRTPSCQIGRHGRSEDRRHGGRAIDSRPPIQITDGSATFAGTKYELQRGNIYFSNPVRIDPAIDIDAISRVETYDITVGLQGTMSHLKPTYRSEPPLSEADIFALLARWAVPRRRRGASTRSGMIQQAAIPRPAHCSAVRSMRRSATASASSSAEARSRSTRRLSARWATRPLASRCRSNRRGS